jgi:hypothetical protein
MRRVSVGSLLRSLYLCYFVQPAADRALFRAVRKRPIRSIVEIGITDISRTQRLLEVASWQVGGAALRYAGVDSFEARPTGQPRLTLKQAFTALKRSTVHVQLVPGEPDAALWRAANSLTRTDLLLMPAGCQPESLARTWIWLPRMLTPTSLVLEQQANGPGKTIRWRPVTVQEIQQRATQAASATRRAA